MTDAGPGRSLVDAGAIVTLATVGFAGAIGFIAVLDADNVASGFGTGFGIALAVFFAGGTIASALACLRRQRAEFVALLSIVAAGLAADMIALAVWRQIDDETYGKVMGVAFVWSLFSLVILGLSLAVGTPRNLARPLYIGAVTAVVAGLISAWLIATAGGGEGVPAGFGFSFTPFGSIGNDELLRLLGAALVVLAALWFAALAASRMELSSPELTR